MLALQETYAHLLVESPSAHAVSVTLNRPEVLNALNTQMGRDLILCFRRISQDGEARAVVLAAAGTRAFCAGADLKERDGMTDLQWLDQHRVFEDALRSVLECRAPVIAAVEGYAFGGGLELALNADFIVASSAASFAQPEVMRGIIPGCGGTQLLPRRIGEARAKELIYSGRRLDAETAERWGLINRLTAPGEAAKAATELAETIARNGPIAVKEAKRAISRGFNLPMHQALAVEIDCYNVTVPTEDRFEGVRAYNERRAPEFTGR